MSNQFTGASVNKTARIAGLLYLLFLVTSAPGLLYVPAKIIVDGNAARTASNLLANESLFRVGITGSLIGQISFVFLVLTLYRLLEGVSKSQARLMVGLVVAAVPIMFSSTLIQMGSLIVLGGADYLKVFSSDQLHALAMVFLNLYDYGVVVLGLFWGLWLLPFGYLVLKSGFLPRTLGVLLMISGVCYLVDSFAFLLVPGYHETVSQFIMAPMAIGELSTILWLLIMGAKNQKPDSATVVG